MKRPPGAALLAAALLLAGVAAPRPARAEAPIDPSARMRSEGAASEYWDLHVRLEDGWLVMVRVLVTNVGPGDHNAVVSGQVVRPDGRVHPFQNGRRRARWRLADDRRHLKIGSSELDLGGPPAFSFFYDSNSRNTHVDVKLVAERPFPVPADVLPDGYSIDVLASAASATATLEVPGMEAPLTKAGVAALVHTVARDPEAESVRRRIEFFSLQREAPLFLLSFEPPTGPKRTWLRYQAPGSEPLEQADFGLEKAGELSGNRAGAGKRRRGAYPVPATLGVPEGAIKMQLRLDEGILELDPLTPLPAPIRWLVSLTMSPRRVWAATGFEVKLPPAPERAPPAAGSSTRNETQSASAGGLRDGGPGQQESEPGAEGGLTAITFTNPLP